jgi:hypothetical protein
MTTLFSRPRDLGKWFVVALAAIFLPSGLEAADHYVSVGASASGTGSFANPWRLQTALSQPAVVDPGDTIWMRGGTYSGSFTSGLTGSLLSPIVLRSYPGEMARIDGAGVSGSQSILTVSGAYTVYRDFEVMSSTNPNPNGGQFSRPQGLNVFAPNNKFVNLIVHDTGQGFGFWEAATNSEITGCLIYYNGNSQLDHGIYTQNLNGTKKLLDNILFRNYGFGVHAYATNAHLNNYEIKGNVSFNNGKLNASNPYKSNYLLGSGQGAATSCTSSPQVAQNPKFIGNYSYHPRGAGGREIDLGYSTGSCNPLATGNYLVGDTTLTLGPAFGIITITGNTFYGPVAGFSTSTYPINTYLSSRPTGIRVFLQPNLYEVGRANIVVYNWNLASSVNVDLSSILSPGAGFQIRNAQNYFAAPVLSGTYAGGSVTLPLTGLTPATPVGQPTPTSTSEFNTFILTQTAPPPSSPTSFYTLTPCRVVDTRRPNGPLGGPAITANSNRSFSLAGQCGIPTTAKAVAINVTATQATAVGYLRLYPGGSVVPPTSSLNYAAVRARANSAIAQLGTSGSLGIQCTQSSGTVHLIIDVNGYFR